MLQCQYFDFGAVPARFRNRFIRLGYTYRVNDVVALLCFRIRSNLLEFIIVDGSTATSFHLCIEDVGLNIIHKQNDFQRSDIRACCDERYGNSNAEILFNSEITNQIVWVIRGVCNLLYKALWHFAAGKLLAEYLFSFVYNFRRVVVILCKNECLGNVFPFLSSVRV